jgi:hypothetical protein
VNVSGERDMTRIGNHWDQLIMNVISATVAVIGGCQGSLTAQTQAAHRLHPLRPMLGHQALPQGQAPRRPAGGGITAAPGDGRRHGSGSAPGSPRPTDPSSTSTGA